MDSIGGEGSSFDELYGVKRRPNNQFARVWPQLDQFCQGHERAAQLKITTVSKLARKHLNQNAPKSNRKRHRKSLN